MPGGIGRAASTRNTAGAEIEYDVVCDALPANARDRTSILGEIKVSKAGSTHTDADPPEFLLRRPAASICSTMAVNSSEATHYADLSECTRKLSEQTVAHGDVARWIRRIGEGIRNPIP